jgi:hypothetical protein
MNRRALLFAALGLAGAVRAGAAGLDSIAHKDAVAGLRAALEAGSGAAVELLGRTDGFYRNERVKIPLPESLARYEPLMRGLGIGRYADELVLAMNRAAEAAVPEAKALLVDAVKKMSVQDAKAILAGGETAGTEYFRRTTSAPLRERFRPIVAKATRTVKLAEVYDRYAEKGAQFGLVAREHANLDDYVTQKALDGLFAIVAEEERKLRRDPARATSELLRRVFGALGP